MLRNCRNHWIKSLHSVKAELLERYHSVPRSVPLGTSPRGSSPSLWTDRRTIGSAREHHHASICRIKPRQRWITAKIRRETAEWKHSGVLPSSGPAHQNALTAAAFTFSFFLQLPASVSRKLLTNSDFVTRILVFLAWLFTEAALIWAPGVAAASSWVHVRTTTTMAQHRGPPPGLTDHVVFLCLSFVREEPSYQSSWYDAAL